jgi:hypothetical protein
MAQLFEDLGGLRIVRPLRFRQIFGDFSCKAQAFSAARAQVPRRSFQAQRRENHMKTRTRLISVLAAATIGMTTLPVTAGGERAEVIAEWNQLLQSNIPSTAGLLTPRYYAMLHVAMFDAANAIEQRYTPYHARLHAHPAASSEAAAAQAGHDVLVALVPTPAAKVLFDTALQARLAKIQPWRAAAGVAVGSRAAEQIIAWRATDGTASPPPPPWTLPLLPGLWQPTSAQGAQLSSFGEFEPFALLTSTQYLADPPPTLTSELYTADWDEVRQLGSATSTVRTAEQTETARLFASVGNSTIHFAMWNSVARDVARQAHWSLVDTARLFALMNASIHDGLQTSHTGKFIYGLWRPVTAIRRADEDLNPATTADTTWTPLISTPPYPSHPSNMTCVGTSAARSLARAFGRDNVSYSVTWIGTGGNANVTRQYGNFSELAAQQARSRVYGGIHFNFELTTSQESCVKVADYVADNYARPLKGWHR